MKQIMTTPCCNPDSGETPAGDSCSCSPDSGCGDAQDQDRSSPFARPGYVLNGFVEDFVNTAAGSTPRVRTRLDRKDYARAALARFGFARDQHRVSPGLYCVGDPAGDSPVLVTANYRLSFDAVRKELSGQDAWILVLDSRGVNVWCAAGKETFSTQEVVLQVKNACLADVVSHRKLILPQLGATGVSARAVKKGCGFEVVWGPVRATDIKAFLDRGMKADKDMRLVKFSFRDRLVLVPVELSLSSRPVLVIAILLMILSGIGAGGFSVSGMLLRGGMLVIALLSAILAGAVITPLFLRQIPGTAFSVKGALVGVLVGAGLAGFYISAQSPLESVALFLLIVAFSSYLAMNFTGATPFTSPSGVEKEIRKALPFQLVGLVLAVALWIRAGFAG